MADNPEYYKISLVIIRAIPSAETPMQHLDDIGNSNRKNI